MKKTCRMVRVVKSCQVSKLLHKIMNKIDKNRHQNIVEIIFYESAKKSLPQGISSSIILVFTFHSY